MELNFVAAVVDDTYCRFRHRGRVAFGVGALVGKCFVIEELAWKCQQTFQPRCHGEWLGHGGCVGLRMW